MNVCGQDFHNLELVVLLVSNSPKSQTTNSHI
jgi:hypothetical protein